MLQPSQLEDVSVRYADEIAEMSEFFTTAGVAVEKPQALAAVVRRLGEDRGFHRDLTSHVWVMLHRRGSDVRYGETLGVVALAAAGKRLAADADEGVAHDLLRFVMGAHDGLNPPARSVDTASVLPEPIAASIESIAPVQNAGADVEKLATPATQVLKNPLITQFPASSREPMHAEVEPFAPVETVEIPPAKPALDTPIRFTRVSAETAEAPRSRLSLWIGLAAVLVLAALVGGWFYRNTSAAPEAVAAPAPVIEGNATPTAAPETPIVKQPEPEAPAVEPTPSEPRPSAPSRNSHSSRVAATSHRQPAPARQTYPVPSPARVAPSA
ncbi:hypothetical protein, partial [Terriglobus sp. ADX1]|uniref:hypothetical protein n=1 Tax=Terriglobus sp. ADX1 TaxID=2794063 RepID=UPI002FE504CC